MFKKILRWHFRNGILLCANEEEVKEGKELIVRYGGKVKHTPKCIMKLLVWSVFPPIFRYTYDYAILYKAKNYDHALEIAKDAANMYGTNELAFDRGL